MNKRIFIFGHKNPDTDTVCAAICLSYLKNKLGLNTIPCVLGNINSETKFALDYFGFNIPYHLNDVKLQIRDVNYHKHNFIGKNSTLKYAFDYMHKHSLTGIPVVEGKNNYFGYISLKEIAQEVINGNAYKIDSSYGNILDILKGVKILKFDKEIYGNLYADEIINKRKINKNSIVITGDNKELIEYAIRERVKLIVLVNNIKISNDLFNLANENKVNVIMSGYNVYDVGNLITLANYVKNFVRSEKDSITFNEVDYLSTFLEKSKQYRHTNYPIINSRHECLGVLTITDTNHILRKQVMLVDHNNFSQSVEGIDEADILEVIDHHNIGDIVTRRPINFRSSICGSTCTMIYDMFNESLVEIPSNIAGLLASAIISDTLLLTSPTTTDKDREALVRLSVIAGIDYKEYGMKMLKKGMNVSHLTAEEMLNKDFKTYKIDDKLIGIGQILIMDYKQIKNRINEIVLYLNQIAKKEGYKLVALFATDVFDNESYCLYNSDAEDIIKNAFDKKQISEGVKLDGILSRKAQILPHIMEIIG